MTENDFCVRDHMDLLAGYVDRKRIMVKNGELKSGNGRPLNVAQTFQDFLPQADQCILEGEASAHRDADALVAVPSKYGGA